VAHFVRRIHFVNYINTLINQNNNKASLYIDAVNIGKAVNYKCSRAKSGNYKLEVL